MSPAAAQGSAEVGGGGSDETAAGDRQVLVSEDGVPYFRAHFRLGPSYDVEEGRAGSSGRTTAVAWAPPSEWVLQAAGLGTARRGAAPPPAGEVEAAAAVSGRVTKEAEVEEMETADGRDGGGGEWLLDKRPRGRSKKAAAKDGGDGGKGATGGGGARQPRRAVSGVDDVPGGSGAGRPAAALPGELGMTYQQVGLWVWRSRDVKGLRGKSATILRIKRNHFSGLFCLWFRTRDEAVVSSE